MNDAAAQRPLALLTRADLRFRRYRLRGQPYWSVKDPLTLRYYQLRGEEYFLLEQLRLPTSLQQLKERFEAHFAPRRIQLGQLQSFLGSLHREGLILSEAPGQGEQLLKRRTQMGRQALIQRLSNVLAIRFRGCDPDRLLDWLHRRLRWMFSPSFLMLCLLLVLSAASFAVLHLVELQTRLPELTSFFTVRTIAWMALALAGSKVIHELGHALTCKHFGGECHELGLMLLVFTPCLYCDVTDSWMTRGKWRRAAVSAAGIAVELVLASLAFFLWWFSEPGLLNSACFSVMTVCSINTLLFNGNPLLRYDGYFVLSDLLETPNLAQRSNDLLRRWLARCCLGVEPQKGRPLTAEQRPFFLFCYAVAAIVYRVVILAVIFWSLSRFLEAYGAERWVYVLAVLVLAGAAVDPLRRTYRFLSRPRGAVSMKRFHLAMTGTALGAAVLLVGWAPLPHRIAAPAVVRPADAQKVFVTIPGELMDAVRVGAPVEQGQPLAVLRDFDLERRIAELQAQRDEQVLHVRHLESRRASDKQADDQLPLAEKTLAEFEERLQTRLRDARRLTLRAPVSGTVMPPPKVEPANDQPAAWSGAPLDAENRGCFLDRRTLLCLVGDPSQHDVVLVIDQTDVQFVRVGLRVKVQLDQLAGEILMGRVTELAEGDLEYVPQELLAAGELPARADEAGRARPASTSYLARVRLETGHRPLLIGATGQARVIAPSETLARRFWRFLHHTFH